MMTFIDTPVLRALLTFDKLMPHKVAEITMPIYTPGSRSSLTLSEAVLWRIRGGEADWYSGLWGRVATQVW